jgi:hypothetical protein
MLDNRSTGNSEPSDPAATAPSDPAATAPSDAAAAAPSGPAEQATATASPADAAIAALADRVATARGKLPLQTDPALFAELSEAEIAAERDLAEWMRKKRREQRRRAVSAELASEKRDRRVALTVRRADDADARWHRRALAARRRASNSDARLAQLYRRAEWSSRALIGVVVLGMLWAGVNVQHNLVPSGDMSDPLYWLSYGFEAMISIPIITIMVVATTAARWGREIARGKVVFLEAALLGVTISLNAGPHLVAGELARAAESAVAPVMVGVVIWLHAWVSARYAQLIEAIPAENDTAPDGPPRRLTHTTVEFGEPRTTAFGEFTPGTTDPVALPIGHTARPDTFASRFDPTAGLFGTPAAEYARPNVASPVPADPCARNAVTREARPVSDGVAATATPQQPLIPTNSPAARNHDGTSASPQAPAADPAPHPQQTHPAVTPQPEPSASGEFTTEYSNSESRVPSPHDGARPATRDGSAHTASIPPSHNMIGDPAAVSTASVRTPDNLPTTGAPVPHSPVAISEPAETDGPTPTPSSHDMHSGTPADHAVSTAPTPVAHDVVTAPRTVATESSRPENVSAPSPRTATPTARHPAQRAAAMSESVTTMSLPEDVRAESPRPTDLPAQPASTTGNPTAADSDESHREQTRHETPRHTDTAAEPDVPVTTTPDESTTTPRESQQDDHARTENTAATNSPARPPVPRAVAEPPQQPAKSTQGTQLTLDEQAVARPRVRPRIVPDPEPVVRSRYEDDARHLPEAHDPWDDGDEIDPDSDETGVWAVAREISARRLSKLPVEQLAEVLTLADESWTPAAIGASIGLPGSRILGILEAARRLARPYAVSG